MGTRLRSQLTHLPRGARRAAPRGQVLIIFAMSLTVVIGILGLSVDAGYLMAQRRGVQAAADAAALAADKAVQKNQTSNVQATGQKYAADNGYANGGGNTVTINNPPSSGPKAGSAQCVEATIKHDVQKFFIGAVYSGAWSVSARGVACTELTQRPYALIALDPGGSGITAGGTSTVHINNGGALSDNAVDMCGTASWLQADGPLDAVNGITICSNATVDAESMNASSPTLADPLAGTPAPNCAGLPVWPNPDIKNSTPTPIVLQPGSYPQGIKISSTPSVTDGVANVITFKSGVYCFGNDLKTNAGSGGWILKGSNVLFYFTGSAMFNVDGGGNDVQIDSGPGGNCTIEACNKQIVIYYAATNCSTLTLVGGNNSNVDGIIYAPCSLIKLGGGSGSTVTGQVFGGSVTIKGGSDLTVNYKQYVDTKIPLVYLVE